MIPTPENTTLEELAKNTQDGFDRADEKFDELTKEMRHSFARADESIAELAKTVQDLSRRSDEQFAEVARRSDEQFVEMMRHSDEQFNELGRMMKVGFDELSERIDHLEQRVTDIETNFFAEIRLLRQDLEKVEQNELNYEDLSSRVKYVELKLGIESGK
ncbi:MAG: hypothetical protein Q8P93_02995 [bacterium]|nr:hypothetical protein [bacterium]